MEITLIGLICFAALALVMARPDTWGVAVFGVFMPLQAAAAVNLNSVGGLSIICVHVLALGFVLATLVRPRRLNAQLVDTLSRPAALLLAAFVAYAVFSAFAMPVLFGGEVDVYSLARPAPGRSISLSALRPTTSNISQSFYLVYEFVLFALIAFMVTRPKGHRSAFILVNAATLVHLVFAVVSVFPHIAPFAKLLETVRTANYAIAAHHTISGFSRLIGSYTEPSAFGAMSTGLFAFNAVRFSQTRGLWHCIASAALLFCVAASMSTTAYAVLGALVVIWCAHTALTLLRSGLYTEHMTAVSASILTGVLVSSLFFYEPARELAAELYERLFRVKMQTHSGVERTAWNMQSLRNLVDTNGFGVGLGSARGSSLIAVLLGNVGVIGALLYLFFLTTAFLRLLPRWAGGGDPAAPTPTATSVDAVLARRVFTAARAGALAMLLAHIIAGTNVDGGVQFFAFAAMASGAFTVLRRHAVNAARTAPVTTAPVTTAPVTTAPGRTVDWPPHWGRAPGAGARAAPVFASPEGAHAAHTARWARPRSYFVGAGGR